MTGCCRKGQGGRDNIGQLIDESYYMTADAKARRKKLRFEPRVLPYSCTS